jgi:hypothetical protein
MKLTAVSHTHTHMHTHVLTVVSVGASSDVFVANLMTLSLAKLHSIWCRMASEKDMQESVLG